MHFSLLGFPVVVEAWFWLTAVLIGGGFGARDADDWASVGIRVITIFLSILFHELGHALAGRRCGALPEIRLHAFGGLAIMHGTRFTRGQDILVTAAGPAASLLLGGLVLAAASFVPTPSRGMQEFLAFALFVNFGWTVLNLLPVQPLDGGFLLRGLLGPSRLRLTAWVSCVTAALVAAAALNFRLWFIAVLFGFFAWQNYPNRPPA